ncbi:hypothetical protein EVAR_57403_1 [Eumeta japonica]|uniref:Uncharacterized protein n=1 Tax=Eumeta variegata TaxID=151549 RepID=A0A4C1YBX4_EUMVA|nr:hypothetical protein EVAR_57403_1 [Eumeta japonica]
MVATPVGCRAGHLDRNRISDGGGSRVIEREWVDRSRDRPQLSLARRNSSAEAATSLITYDVITTSPRSDLLSAGDTLSLSLANVKVDSDVRQTPGLSPPIKKSLDARLMASH